MVVRVSDTLVDGTVIVGAAWGTFEATIAQMVDRLVSSGRLAPTLAAEAVRRIREREAIAGTAMVDIGVSIPHARLEGVDRLVAAMAVSPGAVYQVADGLPISIVVLVLSSPHLTGEHLNFLSEASMILQSVRTRDRLRHASAPAEVLRVVRASEGGRA
jgi:mannitol/fructose-specific phosphotransferase system IIA component (Ntr-type)